MRPLILGWRAPGIPSRVRGFNPEHPDVESGVAKEGGFNFLKIRQLGEGYPSCLQQRGLLPGNERVNGHV